MFRISIQQTSEFRNDGFTRVTAHAAPRNDHQPANLFQQTLKGLVLPISREQMSFSPPLPGRAESVATREIWTSRFASCSDRRRSASIAEAGGSPGPACSRPISPSSPVCRETEGLRGLGARCANSFFHRHRLVSPAAFERLNGYEGGTRLQANAPCGRMDRARSDGREIDQHAHVLIV